MNNNLFPLEDFKAFVNANKALLLMCISIACFSPIIDLVTTLGPPWPTQLYARSLITGVGFILTQMVVFWAFWRFASTARFRFTFFLGTLIALAVMTCIYLYIFVCFTFVDSKEVRHAKGTKWNVAMEEIMNGTQVQGDVGELDLRKKINRFTPEHEILKQVNYDEDKLWDTYSIAAIRLLLLILWVASIRGYPRTYFFVTSRYLNEG